MKDELRVRTQLQYDCIGFTLPDGASYVFNALHAKVSSAYEVDGGTIGAAESCDSFWYVAVVRHNPEGMRSGS